MVYFQKPSLLLPNVKKVGAGDSLSEQHKWNQHLYIQMQAASLAEHGEFHSAGTNCCEGGVEIG